ncbi:hypothetical protein Noda2021_08760 [Candidatus Dependentiae bacterium Noda2021]|nr:hypothetical protein Noda2021_08760 [Candidatus Dependentiae bacterium Noda2021]
MKNMLRALLSLLFLPFGAQAYVYRVDKWQKSDHVVYRFFDNHHATKPTDMHGEKQREEFIQLVQSNHGMAIIEDIEYSLPSTRDQLLEPGKHVYNWMLSQSEYDELLPRYKQNKFLACLASQCGYNGIPHQNIEFRSLISLALSGTIDIHFNDYMSIVNAVIQQLQQDTVQEPWTTVIASLLNKYQYYQHLCQPLLQQLSDNPNHLVNALAQAQWPEGMSAIIPLFDRWGFTQEGLPSAARYKTFIASTFDTTLLEARMVKAVAENLSRPVFIAAGGMHLNNIDDSLAAAGYTFIGGYGYTTLEIINGTATAISLIQAMDHLAQ